MRQSSKLLNPERLPRPTCVSIRSTGKVLNLAAKRLKVRKFEQCKSHQFRPPGRQPGSFPDRSKVYIWDSTNLLYTEYTADSNFSTGWVGGAQFISLRTQAFFVAPSAAMTLSMSNISGCDPNTPTYMLSNAMVSDGTQTITIAQALTTSRWLTIFAWDEASATIHNAPPRHAQI